MKKTFLFITLLLLSAWQVFSANLVLESETSRVELWERFDIYIDVQRDDAESVDSLTIAWIEDFTILGQSTQERFVSINGEVQTQTKLLFTLQGKQSWEFELWPARATTWSWEISSNILSIQVWSVDAVSADESLWDTDDILDIFEETSHKTSLKWYPLLVVLFFVVFYFLISKLLHKKDAIVPEMTQQVESQNDILIWKLKKLKRNAWKQEKSEFYGSYNELVRVFLSSAGYKNTDKMTLKEIKTLDISNTDILSLFEQSYIREFDSKTETIDQRKQLVDDFIAQLKK